MVEKERRISVLLVVVLIVSVIGLTIAFASLSTTLTINGRATMNKSEWDVHFANLSTVKITGDAKEESKPQIVDGGITLENINVVLTKPKDKVEYTVDVVNSGSIDAEISSIQMTELTEEQRKYLEFSAKYSDGKSILEKDVIKSKEKKEVKIVIAFKEDLTVEDLPKDVSTIDLSLTINYVQDDGKEDSDIPTTTNPVGKTYEVGEEIFLGEEHFFVVSDNGDTVTALAKYNLLVGNIFDVDTRIATPIKATTEGYGLQNKDAKAMNNDDSRIGTIAYTELTLSVSNYEAYLKSLGYKTVSVSLPNYNLKEIFGCELDPSGQFFTCAASPSWVYYSSYWFNTVAENGEVYYLSYMDIYTTDPNANHRAGLRPVINISKSEL